LLSFLNLFGTEYLITMSHSSSFELFEFSKNEVYTEAFFQILKYNSYIYKNTFTSLNYYNNSDYILNVYVDKRERFFIL